MNSNVVPYTSLSMIDIELLERCVWRNIKFFSKMSPETVIVNDRVVYKCVFGWQKKNDVVLNMKPFHYSEFKNLYDHLVEKFKLSKALPIFPPKHWWGNTQQAVINERIKTFNEIFVKFNTLMAINNDEKFCNFFNLDLSNKRVDDGSGNVRILDVCKFIIHGEHE